MKNTPNYISIISGKGGTGKSLLASVLGKMLARESKKVLLVDFDIFVRGLSILLSKYYMQPKKPQVLSTSDFFYKENANLNECELLIGRINDYDFIPATQDIGERINFEIDFISNSNEFEHRIMLFKELLLSNSKYEYDYVIFDCRAGIDNSIIQITKMSDYIISVAEDDDVCIQTNSNIINLLRYDFSINNIFTIVNKGRRLTNIRDIEESSLNRLDFNFIGVIPFDIEIMEDYGKERFWNTLNETFYFQSAIRAWNNFAKRTNLDEVSEKQYHSPPKLMGVRNSKMNFLQRAFLAYTYLGFLTGLVLIGLPTFFDNASYEKFTQYGFFILIFSGIMFLFSKLNIRSFLISDLDRPTLKE